MLDGPDRSSFIAATVAAVILAGGSSTRLGSGSNKVYASLGARTLLELSVATCGTVAGLSTVVVVTRAGEGALAREAVGAGPDHDIVFATGGATRLESELGGLEAVRSAVAAGEIDVVVIHDGARPFATSELFREVISAARAFGGGVPAIARREPAFAVEGGSVTRHEPGSIVAVQTPQAFRAAPLLAAYDRAARAGFDAVDTAETVERYGRLEVAAVPGDDRNFKITFESDLARARALAPKWGVGRWI